MAAEPIQDLTAAEARKAFNDFIDDVGPKCRVSVSLNVKTGYGPAESQFSAFFQPNGYGTGNEASFIFGADTFRELLAAVREKWAEHSDLHASNLIRDMALAIIEITALNGECTDAALRAKFEAADITKFGARACEAATSMAANGPFSIVPLAGANDREAA